VKKDSLNSWVKSGTPWIWMNAGAVSIAVIMTLGLLAIIAVRGLAHFWPADVIVADYSMPGAEMRVLAGEVVQAEEVPRARLAASGLPVNVEGGEFMTRELLKVGNREVYGADFSWVIGEWLSNQRKPAELMVLERREWGNFYGYLLNVKEAGQLVAEGDAAWGELQRRIDRVDQLHAQISRIEKVEIGRINHGLERLRLKTRKLELDDRLDAAAQADLDAERAQWDAEYRVLEDKLVALQQQFNRDSITVRTADGREQEITLGKVVRAFQPNAMSTPQKLMFYFAKLWEFVSDEPREANTEGGVFPAIFGTVLMTLIMAVIVTPFGVIAAVYLREYAKQGLLTRIIRIAVNNLAGVPSIVYGVFGLGFFVYVLGGSLDRSRTGAGVRHAWPDVGLADPGHPHPAGGDRRHRGRPGAHPADDPRRLSGSRRDQVRDVVEGGAADGQPGDDDRPDPRCGACRRRSGAADAGRRGQAGAEPAAQRQLPLPASGSEDHAPGLPHLRRRLPEPQRRGGAAAGLRHRAAAGTGDRHAQLQRDLHPQPPAREIQGAGSLIGAASRIVGFRGKHPARMAACSLQPEAANGASTCKPPPIRSTSRPWAATSAA
jgi:ABC-type phosphate transport system auxiliary subunit